MKIGLIMKWGNIFLYYASSPYHLLTEWAVLMVYFWFCICRSWCNEKAVDG